MGIVKKSAGRIAPFFMGDYDNTTTYRRLDWVYYGGTSYICKKNNTIGIVPSNKDNWQQILDLPEDRPILFTEASTVENIISGEKLSVILGKIMKWFIELKKVAFSGNYNDLSNTPNSLKNPNALNIKLNGTSATSYDGSATKEVNVTPAAISAINTSTILTTKEQISANTGVDNITGALAAKAMMSDYTDKFNQLNSNFANKNAINTFAQRQIVEVNRGVDEDSFIDAHIQIYADARDDSGYKAQIGFHNGGVVGVALYLDNDGRFKTISNSGRYDELVYESDLSSLKSSDWDNVEVNPEVMTQNVGCQWNVSGNICCVYMQGYIRIPEEYQEYLLATNLPPSKFGYNPIGLLQEQDSGIVYVIFVNQNGEMRIRSDANPVDGKWVRGSITYIRRQ